MPDIIRIGTRRSQLATWQASYVQAALSQHHPNVQFELTFITTQGDRILDKPLVEIGGKGLFTLELEAALHAGDIDLAVHSLKDLPTDMPEGFTLGAVPDRANPFDALVSRSGEYLADLPENAVVGTSSLRRQAQLKHFRSDLLMQSIRGNVDTRIKKALDPDGPFDAIVLAMAGLTRLGLTEHITQQIDPNVMLPAPAQGALGIQCRDEDDHVLTLLQPLDHEATRLAVTAERSYLNELEAGCRLPVAAYATFVGPNLELKGRVNSVDGHTVVSVSRQLPVASLKPSLRDKFAVKLGRDSAREAMIKGADTLIAAVKAEIAAEDDR